MERGFGSRSRAHDGGPMIISAQLCQLLFNSDGRNPVEDTEERMEDSTDQGV
jgi:hypothetical protein